MPLPWNSLGLADLSEEITYCSTCSLVLGHSSSHLLFQFSLFSFFVIFMMLHPSASHLPPTLTTSITAHKTQAKHVLNRPDDEVHYTLWCERGLFTRLETGTAYLQRLQACKCHFLANALLNELTFIGEENPNHLSPLSVKHKMWCCPATPSCSHIHWTHTKIHNPHRLSFDFRATFCQLLWFGLLYIHVAVSRMKTLLLTTSDIWHNVELCIRARW